MVHKITTDGFKVSLTPLHANDYVVFANGAVIAGRSSSNVPVGIEPS